MQIECHHTLVAYGCGAKIVIDCDLKIFEVLCDV